MKTNRRYIIPDPVKTNDFEVRWHLVEIECIEAAKKVGGWLKSMIGSKMFFNVSNAQQSGLKSLHRRRNEENG